MGPAVSLARRLPWDCALSRRGGKGSCFLPSPQHDNGHGCCLKFHSEAWPFLHMPRGSPGQLQPTMSGSGQGTGGRGRGSWGWF